MAQVVITLTQDQAEHALLCARMALAQAQLAIIEAAKHSAAGRECLTIRRDTLATLVDVLQKQIIER